MPAILPAQPYPLGGPNGFNLPCSQLGINYAHPATAKGYGSGFSAATIGFGMCELYSGKVLIETGTPTPSIFSSIGPSNTFLFSTDSFGLSSGLVTSAQTQITFGAIVYLTSLPITNRTILTTDGNGPAIFFTNGAQLAIYTSGTNAATNITFGVNIPYFVGVSAIQNGTGNFVLMNMATGQLQTQSITLSGSFGTLSNVVVGNNFGGGGPLAGAIAVAMFSLGKFLSMPQLIQWAYDPWSFWYPNSFDLATSISSFGGQQLGRSDVAGIVEYEC